MRQSLNTHPVRLKAKNTGWPRRNFCVGVSPTCRLHFFMEPLTTEEDTITRDRNVGKQLQIPKKGILNHTGAITSNPHSTSLVHNVAKTQLQHIRLSERYCRRFVFMPSTKCAQDSRGWWKYERNGYRRKTKIRSPVLDLRFTTPKGPWIDFKGTGKKNYSFIFSNSGFGGLEVACWPLVPEWSRGSVLAFGTRVV